MGGGQVSDLREVPGSASASALPRVGAIAGWFDPEDTRAWSGVPASILAELRTMVDFAGVLNAMPFLPATRAVHQVRRKLHRLPEGWPLSPEMRALGTLTGFQRRRSAPSDVDGWVHLCGGYGPMVGARFVAIGEICPSLLTSSPEWAGSFGFAGAGSRGLQWVARQHFETYRRAQACCVASRWIADGLVRDGIDHRKMRIIGYGPNVAMDPPPSREWSLPRFLFVGRDWQRKNGEGVVRAFVQLRTMVPEARLDVVGFHPERDIQGVTFHGPLSVFDPVERARLEELFRRATCFVLPSILEPFGIVYVEAARVGLASIATRRGGTRDSVGEGGILVDPGDDGEILRAMRQMCDPQTARELGAIAARRSEIFTWRATAQRVLTAFDFGDPGQGPMADVIG